MIHLSHNKNMAHFAELDSNNIVKRTLVVSNFDIIDENGNESEEKGILFLQKLCGENTRWKQTSYNGSFRNQYGSTGDTYREDLDAFISPSPYPSWTLNENTLKWNPPIPKPDDIVTEHMITTYLWDENNQEWIAETENI